MKACAPDRWNPSRSATWRKDGAMTEARCSLSIYPSRGREGVLLLPDEEREESARGSLAAFFMAFEVRGRPLCGDCGDHPDHPHTGICSPEALLYHPVSLSPQLFLRRL